MLVLLTAIDQVNYYVCCVTRQCLFRIHFFASKRLSECPAYLYNYIYLLLSPFLFKCNLFEHLSQSQNTTKYYVTKRKSPQFFDQRKPRHLSSIIRLKRAFIVITMIKTVDNIKREILNIKHGLPKKLSAN